MIVVTDKVHFIPNIYGVEPYWLSVITESESHSTLTTVVSMIDIQSDTMDNKGESTPYPREKISDETLNLLVAASNKLAQDLPKE